MEELVALHAGQDGCEIDKGLGVFLRKLWLRVVHSGPSASFARIGGRSRRSHGLSFKLADNVNTYAWGTVLGSAFWFASTPAHRTTEHGLVGEIIKPIIIGSGHRGHLDL